MSNIDIDNKLIENVLQCRRYMRYFKKVFNLTGDWNEQIAENFFEFPLKNEIQTLAQAQKYQRNIAIKRIFQ